jgi:hypothetical protein
LPALRLAELVCQFLFVRKQLATIDKPPRHLNLNKYQQRASPDQLEFCYA